jgi:hypothetical protein
VQHGNSFRFTLVEKANGFDIYEGQFLQIQNCWGFAKLEFGFDLIQVRRPKLSTQPNPRSGPFNPERHENRGSEVASMGMQGKAHSRLAEKVELRRAGDARF